MAKSTAAHRLAQGVHVDGLIMPVIDPESEEVLYLRSRDWRLSHLIGHVGPLEYKLQDSAFSNLAHSIVEQMLSMKAAETIERRIYALCDDDFCPRTVASISVDKIRACGVSARKALHLHELAEYAMSEDLERLSGLSNDEIRTTLTRLPGVGKWTCDMFLLFYLERQDVLPIEDTAFRQAFQWLYGAPVEEPAVCKVVCELWHPYSSIAVRYLYRALNTGLVKEIESASLWTIADNPLN